jgi:hypothetical protein
MSYILNLGAEVRPVNTPVVRDRDDRTPSGACIPSADLHARRHAREAERWIAFARERTRMQDATLVRKALDACTFSAHHHTQSLAVPSKLSGTGQHQRALWAVVREGRSRWCPLDLHVEGGRLLVSMPGGGTLGEVQAKHTPWLTPLTRFGVRVYLGWVTGHEREGYRLGCNVVFGHVGAALERLRHALGGSGDGATLPAGLALRPQQGAPEGPSGDDSADPHVA